MVDTDNQALKYIGELRRREGIINLIRRNSFPAQLKFLDDPAPLKAALTTRRSGKTVAAGIDFITTGIRIPGCSMLYTGLTRDSCVRILKKEILDKQTHKYRIKTRWNGSTLTMTFSEYGSTLYMLGVDSSEKERDKALGLPYAKVYIDESASYTLDQRILVYNILKPAVADLNGQICMIGTPGNNIYSLFAEITRGIEPGWSNHAWTAFDNPYMKKAWRREIDELIKMNPGIEETASFKQMYLGQWVIDESKLVYHFNMHRDLIDELPFPTNKQQMWHYVMGMDLGYDDATAFTVVAYREFDKNIYVVESYKRAGMTLTDVAELYHSYFAKKYRPERTEVDGSDKQAVEELKQRLGMPLTAAERHAKADFIAICNDDFVQGRIKVLRGSTGPLQDEWKNLVWDERALQKGKRVELSSCANHCADSFLYPWRYCYSWVDRGAPDRGILAGEEQVEKFWEDEAERGGRDIDAPFWER